MGSSLLSDESSYLSPSDLLEIEEEGDFPANFWKRTDHVCSDCEEPICFDEEVVLIKVVVAQRIGDQVECYDLLDDNEEFQYEPLFIHFECWEDACDDFHSQITDEPPAVSDAPHLDLVYCRFCKQGIRAWESFAHTSLGEIGVSDKRRAVKFKESEGATPEAVCLSCIERINEEIQLWRTDNNGMG